MTEESIIHARLPNYVSISLGAGTLFIAVVVLLNCVHGQKKKRKESKRASGRQLFGSQSSSEVQVNIEDVVPENVDEVTSSDAPKTDNNSTHPSNHFSNTLISIHDKLRRVKSYDQPSNNYEQYDPKRSSLPLLANDDYVINYGKIQNEKIANDLNPINRVQSIDSQSVIETSGNSYTGSAIYARVKNVPQKEELAYSVVPVTDSSQQQYDVVNGNIIRKLPKEASKENVNKEEDSNSRKLLDLYAQPDITTTKKEETPEQENSGSSGYYASVTEKKKEIQTVSQENSGNSGYYESCGPLTVDLPSKVSTQVDVKVESSTYEAVTESVLSVHKDDKNETSKELKQNDSKHKKSKHKGKGEKHISKENKKSIKVKKSHSRGDKKSFKYDKEYIKPEGKHSKEDIAEHSKREVEQPSPGVSSRFSRVNPFKLSKKHKPEPDHEARDNNSENSSQDTSSLPRENEKQLEEESKDKHPPPLPSYDKLLSITENKKSKRSSSIGETVSSDGSEPSPHTSPRSAPFVGSNKQSFNFDSRHTSGHGELPPPQEEDERYSEVGKNLKEEITMRKNDSHQNLNEHLKNSRANTSPVKVIAYATVKTEQNTNIDLNNKGSEWNSDDDHDYADISWKDGKVSMKPVSEVTSEMEERNDSTNQMEERNDSTNQNGSVVEEQYAVVDLEKKHREREIKELYSSINWSTKLPKQEVEINIEKKDDPLYEDNYRVISDLKLET